MQRKAREAELYAQRISMSLADVNGEGRKHMFASHGLINDPLVSFIFQFIQFESCSSKSSKCPCETIQRNPF